MFELTSVSYSRGSKKNLHNISLQLHPGKVYAVVGLNGSGKTTLLKVMSQIWAHTEGSVTWCGENLALKSRLEISRLISMVSHNQPVTFSYSVYDIVAMGGYANGLINNRDSIEEALFQVDAWDLKDRLITQISHGERQRVLIARSLVNGSPTLLFDEPSTGLDTKHQIDIWKLLKSLREKGKLIVLSTHDLEMVKVLCDEVILLYNGHCLGIGPYNKVLTPAVLSEMFGLIENPAEITVN